MDLRGFFHLRSALPFFHLSVVPLPQNLPILCTRCNLTLMSVKVDSLILANGVIVQRTSQAAKC